MLTIILNEWKILIRNRAIVYITILFIMSLVSVSWIGVVQNNNQKGIQQSAQKHIRSQWDNLKPMNPHRAAHYGSVSYTQLTLPTKRIV